MAASILGQMDTGRRKVIESRLRKNNENKRKRKMRAKLQIAFEMVFKYPEGFFCSLIFAAANRKLRARYRNFGEVGRKGKFTAPK